MQRRVAVVGAGIVGLAHAWSAAERGWRVTIFERHAQAIGASIRNFGMVWPIGQPSGELYQTAMLSRARWLQLADAARLWVNPCGSIHLAHRADEWTVLQQFSSAAPSLQISCQLLSADEIRQRTPAANPQGLLGGLYSPGELCVNPREAIGTIPGWLRERFGVDVRYSTQVVRVQPAEQQAGNQVAVTTAGNETSDFERVIICCGAEFESLFPEVLAASGLKRCKLQMMSIRNVGTDWHLGPHLASGLTLRHYRNFEICDGLPALKQRIAAETPELDQFGIHVMASQNNHGDLILGDSHEYDSEIEPFDKSRIDQLMLRELRKILCLPDWDISERWHGIYAKHPTRPVFEASPMPGVFVCTGTGGAGMTMSFGLAERLWDRWDHASL